jgi:cytochrome c5
MRRSSLSLIFLAASLSACGDPTGAADELAIEIKTSAAAYAYLDGRLTDGIEVYYHTCDDVPVTATALRGYQGDVATWGNARLTLRGLATNAKLAEQSFSASEVAGWWGGPAITAGFTRKMRWNVRAKEAFRAEIEYDYTVAKASGASINRMAEISFTCAYKPL